MKLLTKASNTLLASGFDQLETTYQNRGKGIRHTVFRWEDEEFHLGAKEYVYRGLASFAANQVDHAIARDANLVLYVNQDDSFTVFDPEFVKAEATVIVDSGKQVTEQEWLNVPMVHGVDLVSYIKDGTNPDTLAGENATLDGFF